MCLKTKQVAVKSQDTSAMLHLMRRQHVCVTSRCSNDIISKMILYQNRCHYYNTRISILNESIERKQVRQELILQQQLLYNRANVLTKSFFRLVLRSIRIIRIGNENDEIEFNQREKKQLLQQEELLYNIHNIDKRLDMISMSPDIDRVDELLSRANYYTDYTREQIHQESDRLSNPFVNSSILWNNPDNVYRYISLLQRGEQHRKWLLKDMKFIPVLECKTPTKIVYEQFQKDALQHIRTVRNFEDSDDD